MLNKLTFRHIAMYAALLITSLVWGFSLPAQARGMEQLNDSANGFNAVSSLLGALALLVPIMLMKTQRRAAVSGSGRLWLKGIVCGVVMTAASLLQQWALKDTTAGKTGFLSSLYVVAVPLLGALFHRRSTIGLWAATALSVFGVWLLCRPTGGAAFTWGDLCALACAVFFAIHILLIDRWSELESLPFCAFQLVTTGILSFVAAAVCRDRLTWDGFVQALPLLLYCGVLSIGAGYTVQIYTQKFLHPTASAIILSTESFFALLGGWLFLGERLSRPILLGGAAIFAATIIAQLFGAGKPVRE